MWRWALGMAVSGLGWSAPALAEVVDRLVVVVGGQPLLASEIALDADITEIDPTEVPFWRMAIATSPGQDEDTERAIDALIVRGVAADVQLYQPTREQLDERIAAVRARFGGPDAETEERWRTFMVAHGLDAERLEVVIRRRMVVERFLLRNLEASPSDPRWTTQCASMLDQLRPRVRVRRIKAPAPPPAAGAPATSPGTPPMPAQAPAPVPPATAPPAPEPQ